MPVSGWKSGTGFQPVSGLRGRFGCGYARAVIFAIFFSIVRCSHCLLINVEKFERKVAKIAKKRNLKPET